MTNVQFDAYNNNTLLSSASKDLSVIELAMKNDDECRDMFAKIRWSDTDGTPACPHCGTVGNYWFLPSTKRYKCKSCKKSYSITTNTIFADRKMSFKQYLVAIFLFANNSRSVMKSFSYLLTSI